MGTEWEEEGLELKRKKKKDFSWREKRKNLEIDQLFLIFPTLNIQVISEVF